MTELLTAAQMRAIEQAAIDSGEVTGLELMERAGRGVVEAVLEEWPEMAMTSGRAVVLCGPGNNGGDGFVVARLLKDRGWAVEVFLYGEMDKLPPDAKTNAERWLGGISPLNQTSLQESNTELPNEDGVLEGGVLIDAVFGTGLSRPIDQDLRVCLSTAMTQVPMCFLRVVSVDVPSGVCADSGNTLRQDGTDPIVLRSDLTVSFHTAKTGHYLADASRSGQKISVVDIGLDNIRACHPKINFDGTMVEELDIRIASALEGSATDFMQQEREAFFSQMAQLENIEPETELIGGMGWNVDKAETPFDHKFGHGYALILSGENTKTGASRLAARGALRIGGGVVTIASPKNAMAEHAAQLNAIMLREVDSPADFSKMLEDTRINALCLGPALGLGNKTRKLIKVALKSGRATVLDADALTIFKDDPETLFGMLHKNVVLTPHGGEFARLFPDIAEKLAAPATKGPAYSKVDATRDAAKRAGCVVLYKGADTVIAGPDGRASINSAHYDRAAPWLATAGSGDVLAGFITGLLARGFGPMQAAETAAWLHVECARSFGPGLIAEDLPEQLPKVFRDLGL